MERDTTGESKERKKSIKKWKNAQSFRRRRERILVDDVVIVTDAVLLLLLLGGGGGHASSSRSESAVVRFIRENRNRASLSLSF